VTSVKLRRTDLIVSDKARNIVKEKVPAVAYVNVNIHEHDDDDTLMLNGFSYVLADKTYYIQHTSKRPIAVWTAEEFAEKLAIEFLVAEDEAAGVPVITVD
jgi:hypothetical protein